MNVLGQKKEAQTSHFGKSRSQSRDNKRFGSRQRSRSQTKKKDESPLVYTSPRRKLYEAKFEKYVANKENKKVQEKRLEKMAKEDFDRYTKGEDSPSK